MESTSLWVYPNIKIGQYNVSPLMIMFDIPIFGGFVTLNTQISCNIKKELLPKRS